MLALTACGGGGASDSAQVASIDAAGSADSSTETTSPADTQEAWLDFAQCMRDNGVDMQDPTFDADGNVQGGFGPDSGIDFRDEGTQTAMETCGDLIQDLGLGGGGGRAGFDPDQIQTALADYTACLRDQGLDVDDVTFGGPGGGAGGGPAPDGSVPAGGFQPPAGGSLPDGAQPGGAQGGVPEGGAGFDPTERIVEQLGLDADDPAVSAALGACQSLLDAAFQPADGSADAAGGDA